MRIVTGTVVSTKMAKTLAVQVDTSKKHSKYHKRYRASKKYYAHVDSLDGYEEGTTVTLAEARPTSKLKRWRVVRDVVEVKKAA
jgi:small subunit ribosomal protein S17